ncbi:putative RNA-binding protein [Colletotrichum chlorophyti]|uniref:Putative RNA-binding protein n=1 Tax=Colletotrichum chlorophyti TaxID=708187 RepID=A0A1Q8S7M3_9PEZI|nr:putative RNA-binding protein [Colletotrichum chlorophyti]
MLVPSEDTPLLKAWLMKKLPEVSDTETDILAEYIGALLNSQEGDATQIRASCENELPQFLNTDAAPEFVDELFRVIEHKSYLPGAPPPPKKQSESQLPSAVLSSDFTAQSGSRKRSYQERGDVGASGDRDIAFEERAYKQPRRGQWDSRVSDLKGYGSPNSYPSHPFTSGGSHQPLPGTAPYDPNFPQPPTGLNDWHGLPQVPVYSQGVPYGPPQGPRRNRQRCRDFATKGYCARGNSCQYDHGTEPIWLPPSGPSGPPKFEDFDPRDAAMMMSQNFHQMQQLMEAINAERGARKPRRGGKGRRRPNRASFSAEGPVSDRSKTTIVVENIPEEYLSEDEVRKFFAEFGNIEQISIQPHKRLATVKYDTWDAANAAYRSPKVIFNNRFVKVFWFVEESEQAATATGGADAEESAEPEIDMEEFLKKQEQAQKQHEEKLQKRGELEKQRQELEQRQRELLAQHREVQQKLQAKLALKNCGVENPDDESGSVNSALRRQLAALEDEAKLLGLDPSIADEPTPWYPNSRGRGRGRGGFVLRGRGSAPRGRGSYRGGYRGDVHVAYAAYSLDNRPRTVCVIGVDFTSSEKDEALRQYLLGLGEFTDIKTTSSKTEVTFKDRKTAEKFYYGLPKQDIPGIDDKLELSWVATPLPPVKLSTENGTVNPQGASDQDMAMGSAAPNGSSASTIDQQPEQQPEMDYDVADDDDWGVE